MVEVITISTDGHKMLSKQLEASIKNITGHQLKICHINGEDGDYGSDNYNNACIEKIIHIISHLNKLNEGDYLIYIDSDVLIFGNIINNMIEQLGDRDIIFQDDTNRQYCAGVFICKNNKNIRSFFSMIYNELRANYEKYINTNVDQTAINHFIHKSNLKHGALNQQYSSYGLCKIGRRFLPHLWIPGTKFRIKNNILLFHLNWTVSLHNKIELLNYVKSIIKS